MKRIIVSVTNDLTTDQRVEKVCNSLVSNKFDILLIGRKLNNTLPIQRNYKTKRITLLFNKGFLFYAEYNIRLFLILLFSKKDYLLANDLDTLLPNYLISKMFNKTLIYDSHELFSEIPELIHRKKIKKVWTNLEKKILPKLKNCYTVCNSISNYYNSRYHTNFKVIRNLPFQQNTIKKASFDFDTSGKKIILYQGSVNIGRGLELMIETVQYLPNFIFVIIGDGDIIQELKTTVSNKKYSNIQFMDRMEPKKLKKFTLLADIGISIEEDLGLNYRYALPNKIFDYIQAEVPILVSNLPEMKQIVRQYKVGEIVKDRNPKNLALQIKKMAEKDFSSTLKETKKELIWENEEEKLLSIFNNLK